jgi:hypothetical protein
VRRIDSKYHISDDGQIVKVNGVAIPEDEPLFLLRGKDKVALQTLREYRKHCITSNCVAEHIDGIDQMIAVFEQFWLAHPERMKRPGDPNA